MLFTQDCSDTVAVGRSVFSDPAGLHQQSRGHLQALTPVGSSSGAPRTGKAAPSSTPELCHTAPVKSRKRSWAPSGALASKRTPLGVPCAAEHLSKAQLQRQQGMLKGWLTSARKAPPKEVRICCLPWSLLTTPTEQVGCATSRTFNPDYLRPVCPVLEAKSFLGGTYDACCIFIAASVCRKLREATAAWQLPLPHQEAAAAAVPGRAQVLRACPLHTRASWRRGTSISRAPAHRTGRQRVPLWHHMPLCSSSPLMWTCSTAAAVTAPQCPVLKPRPGMTAWAASI